MSLNKIPGRAVLYTSDVKNITGGSTRASQRLMRKIRQAFGETGQRFVTVKEFSKFCKMEEEEVQKYLTA
jgi:hypothetical protein